MEFPNHATKGSEVVTRSPSSMYQWRLWQKNADGEWVLILTSPKLGDLRDALVPRRFHKRPALRIYIN